MRRNTLIIFILLIAVLPMKAQYSKLMNTADSLLDEHDNFHAMQLYEQACKLNNNANVMRRIAECYFQRADYKNCVNTLNKISLFNSDSLDHEALREMVFSYKFLANPSAQLVWGLQLIERYPFDAEVVALVASLYLNEVNMYLPSNAYRITKAYFDKDSTNILVTRKYADSYFFMQEFDNAAKVYHYLLSLGDSTYNVFYSLGMCYDQTKNLPLAREYLTKAAKINEFNNAGCLYRLGIVCVDMGKVDEGIDYLNKAQELLEPDPTIMFIIKRALGEGFYKKKEWQSAIYAWKDAVKYNSNSSTTYYNLAQAYNVVGEHNSEKECYKAFLSMVKKEKANDALKDMIKIAEGVVGKNTVVGDGIYVPNL
jgi:tetratricopeptide (TPR) repeat protein